MCQINMSSSSDDYSCVSVSKKTIHITMPTVFIGNPVSGVHEILEARKNQYEPSLEGILLSYKNVSVKNKLGGIISDRPFVHYDVEAEFSIFKPSIGAILQGTINRISREHVGCIVHDCLNVSIHHITSLASDMSELIAIGKVIFFKVTEIETLRRTVRIHGEISRECYRLMMGLQIDGVAKDENDDLDDEKVELE